MNTLTKSILTLASYDDKASDISMENVLRQCLMLISVFADDGSLWISWLQSLRQ